MGDSVLELRKLSVVLPPSAERKNAVSDVHLELLRNEVLCVVGESGSGKTIMARSVLGLLPPRVHITAGEILLEGEDLRKASAARMREIRGKRISMIFQEPRSALNPVKTIGSQIEEVLKIHTALGRRARLSLMRNLLESVKLSDPDRILVRYPHQISGGQCQRAMIAMALALEPAVLIADEPTTALDVTTQAQILRLIRDIQLARHMSVLFITHDFGVVAQIADRVAVMQNGVLVEAGDAKQVLNFPRHPYTRSLIASVPDLVPKRLARSSEAAAVLSVADLDKTFPAPRVFPGKTKVVHAVKTVTLTVKRGETLGLIGESGSGKSTLARCITRLIDANHGSVFVEDVDLMKLHGRALRPYRRRLQMVFQDPYGSLDPRQTVRQIIVEGPIAAGISNATAHARMRSLLGLVGLDESAADRYPHEFSGGQRQRVAIARALALEPEILVADEPVSALDVSVQAQVLKLLAAVRDRLNLAMIFITHDLRVAAQLCDTIAVMRYGEIVEYGTAAAVYGEPKHPYTQELFDAVPGKDFV
ncbi:MAG: ABC transporter ATP-binding protein [Vulcanimicrobiaceae bacterium]